MEKKIEYYIHLLIGQIIRIEFGNSPWSNRKYGDYELIGYNKLAMDLQVNLIPIGMPLPMWYSWKEEHKFILRPLSDMTYKEAKEWLQTLHNAADILVIDKTNVGFGFNPKAATTSRFINFESFKHGYPDGFRYLLSQGFDLFNLIESGLAIDKTTIK